MTNNLEKRGSVYYFRRKIPIDLQKHFGRAQIMYSLQTRDPAEAKRLAAQHTVDTNNQFQAARASIAKPAVAPKREPVILREYVLDPDTRDSLPSGQKILFDPANPGDHVEVTLAGEPVALLCEDAVLGRAGASISKSYKRQLKDARSFKTGLLVARALDAGRTSSQATPDTSTRAKAARREVTRMDAPAHLKNLQHVVPSWIARNAPKPTSIRYARKAIALFEEAVGVIPLRELTKAHGAAFVRFLLDSEARGFKNKTAGNHAASITALLNVAVKDDLIERNPLDLTFDKTVGAEKREPWTATELATIYGSALFSDKMEGVPKWQDIKSADGRALLLMLLHTGARIGEIAQLRRSDFLIRDGITAIHITGAAGTVKTADSERVIPLADHLLSDPWFSRWLAEVMDGTRPHDAAMASMAGRKRGPSDAASKWFREFRKYVKLPPGRLNGSHKFRHWIRSALAAKDVGTETADAITGHSAEGSAGRVSYTKIALPTMLAALNRLVYPTISLTR